MVKRATIVGDIEDGGLKMVDVKSMFKALRVKWTQRYSDGNHAARKVLLINSQLPMDESCFFIVMLIISS